MKKRRKTARRKAATKPRPISRNKDIIYLEHKLKENVPQMLEWLVQKRPGPAIVELLWERYKIKTSRKAVWRFSKSKKWKSLLIIMRKKFENRVYASACANQTDRLAILQRVIDESFKWTLKSVSKEGQEIYELNLGPAVAAVKQAKVEMEGVEPLVKIEKHYHFSNIKTKELEAKDESDLIGEVLGRRAGPVVLGRK